MITCKQAVATLAALPAFSIGIADALVMLRVSVLWDRQRSILVTFFLAFLVTYSITIICAVLTGIRLDAGTTFIPEFRMCVPGWDMSPRAVIGVWVPGMAFDCLVLSLTAWNACARPRTQETALTTALYRDGVVVFLILAGLRILNVILSILSPHFFLIGMFIAWPISTVTLSRFIFSLHSLEKGPTLSSASSYDMNLQYTDTDAEPCNTLGPSSSYSQAHHDSEGWVNPEVADFRGTKAAGILTVAESEQC
ncbi:hypothetical protein JB92DRAFT_419749 [Gautieria morchelliformis]|nr:hypothetical protein JB92DRAFT_419749 [Gautieria morchelliformis]